MTELLSYISVALAELWSVLNQMSPYLLFGFFVAGLLSIFVSAAFVERHLGGGGVWPVIKATVLGIPLPLCSCGVIPVAASLRRHRATRGATTAFLISTPQTGVDSILVTFGLLGGVFTVFRVIAALVNGVVGGLIINAVDPRGEAEGDTAVSCTDECCSPTHSGGRFVRAMKYGFGTLVADIAWPLVIGLLIAAGISLLVPDDFFQTYLGAGLVAMLVMLAAGIPLYVCATASVPIAAALIAKGVTPGAALVFLMTGPATNAAAVTTIWTIMGRRTAVTYLATVAGTALASGLVLDAVYRGLDVSAMVETHAMLPGWVGAASSVALIAVLAHAIVRRGRFGHDDDGHGASDAAGTHEHEHETLTLAIRGMTCSHCAETVRRTLLELPNVEQAEVNLAEGRAVIVGHDIDVDALTGEVESVGYHAEPAEPESG